MRSGRPLQVPPSNRIPLVALAMLLTLCAGPACAAPEPGTVTIVLAAEPMSVDPGDSTSSIHGQVLRKNVLEALTDMHPDDSSIIPKLALSWKRIDPYTWHFFLRKKALITLM